jgi:hypothetical protein
MTPHRALPRCPPADDECYTAASLPAGILDHLDAVYGFALTLTGDADRAAELTESAYGSDHDDLWSTLGGHRLPDRLLARCVAAFMDAGPPISAGGSTTPRRDDVSAVLRGLPWTSRAAIALVDQLGLTYSAGAAVLRTDVDEFREYLHRGRSVLFAAYRAGAR